MICKKCGTNNDSNTGKCIKCGAKLSASKEKESVFDISVSSVLVMIFSLVAVLVLLIPDTRTVSIMEIVTGAPSVQDDNAIALLEEIKSGQSIANERDKIDKNLAVLNDGGSSSAKMFIIDSWTPDEAITVLEEAKNSPDVDVPTRVSGIRERVAKVEAKQAEVDELTAEIAPDVAALESLNSRLSVIKPILEANTNEAYVAYLMKQKDGYEKALEKEQKKLDTLEEELAFVAETDESYAERKLNRDNQQKEVNGLKATIQEYNEQIQRYPVGTLNDKTPLDATVAAELRQEVQEKESAAAVLENKLREPLARLKKLNEELDALKQDLENYITESINALHPDDVDRGALGGVVREHRTIQPMIENIALVLAILTMVFFVLTIIAWATKFYRLRLITMIADIVLTLATFFVPLVVWSIEYKWPYEVFGNVTYGFNFGQTFILVLVCAIGVLAAGFAYFSDMFTASKKP